MGVTICPQHGWQALFLACEHVRQSIETGASPPPYRLHRVRLATMPSGIEIPWMTDSWLCAACASRVGWYEAEQTEQASTAVWERIADLVSPSCERCAHERLAERWPAQPPAPERTVR